MIFEGVVESAVLMLREVVEWGIERDEVRPEAVNGYVSDVMPGLVVYRSKVCGCEWRHGEVEEGVHP
ncbi:hypothetical protein [Streptomyces sp. SID5643]|uniref:hypothetical protein n=1 Tax=Streptomyces sp. SID5643 TaxID=2690307 RepID=UPI001371A791|nr:hypothetical protein [Streptomyces sp. SID5643]